MGGMFGGASGAPKAFSETGVIDSHGRFVTKQYDDPKIQSAMSAFAGSDPQQAIIFIELPDKPVRVGDSWTMPMSGGKIMGLENAKMKLTFVGTGEVHGHPVWKVRVSGHYPIAMDMGKILSKMGSMGGQGANADAMKKLSMTITGTMELSGSGAVDQRSGKTVALNNGVTMHVNVSMNSPQSSGQPTSMKMDVKMLSEMNLKGY
jgi:hypothetical protein